jgi:hypothetical protein
MCWRSLTAAAVACITTLACGSAAAPASPTKSQPPDSALGPNRLVVRAPLVFAGDLGQARATAFISLEAVDVTPAAQWESSAPGVATINGSGQVTARSAGITQLTARYQAMTASAPLTVFTDADVRALYVESCGGPVLVGQTLDCAATVQVTGFPDILNIADKATWGTTNPSIVNVTVGGRVAAIAPGQATIWATYHGVTAGTTFDVRTAEQDAITETGAGGPGSFQAGHTATIDMTVLYSVVSAPTGILVLHVMDQARDVASTTPLIVPRGSNEQALVLTFTVPPTSTIICPMASLTVGTNTIRTLVDRYSCSPVR